MQAALLQFLVSQIPPIFLARFNGDGVVFFKQGGRS